MAKEDCRNDCTTPLRFPRRPGTSFFVGSGDDCFCCDTEGRISPDNRPALPHFNYRIGTYASIREYLLHEIDHTENLQNWTHREPDDPAIALLEGAAILGDILTFYQETYANEAYLRTAKWRDSVNDLVRLLGYRLSPALGGNATFAFEIKKDEAVTVPAGFPVKATLEELEKPADFETVSEITAYPWLSRFNLFRPLSQPVISYSTTEFYISAPNQLLAPIEIKEGDRLMIGKSDATGTNQPDKLTNAEIVIVDSIRELHGAKIFKIKGNLTRNNNVTELAAYKLGRVFHHFGYNSPLEFIEPTEDPEAPVKITSVPNKRKINGTTTNDVISTNFKEKDFPIDAEIKDLPGNIPVIIQGTFSKAASKGGKKAAPKAVANMQDLFNLGDLEAGITQDFNVGFGVTQKQAKAIGTEAQASKGAATKGKTAPKSLTLVRTATEIFTDFYQWGQLTGAVSALRFSKSLADSTGGRDQVNIRNILFHETISPLFIIKEAGRETQQTGNALNFYGTAAQVQNLKDREIMLEKSGEEPYFLTVLTVTTASDPATSAFEQLHKVTVSDTVDYDDFPNEDPVVTVFGNLAEADQGKTQPEIVLGSGDNTKTFQTFKLSKSPLTYLLETANTPPETPELEIYVGGRLWQKVDSFFDRGADEQIYIVREDADDNSWVQFGDGKTGAKLPTGIKNVSAVYRTGAGAFGALKADTKVQAGAKLKNLDQIQMPLVASGGTERESGDNAKNSAPGKVQSLGRLVSLRDFESEASAIAGVAAVSAAWKIGKENIPAMVVTILMDTGRSGELASVRETLSGYNASRGAARFPVEVVAGKRLYVTVSVQYALDPTYRADLIEPEIRKALGVNFGLAFNKEDQTGLFSLRRRRFGAREYASSIEGAVQSVAGVIWARVTAFAALSDNDDPDEITLPDGPVFQSIVSCSEGEHVDLEPGESVEHILSLYDAHLFLTPTVEEAN